MADPETKAAGGAGASDSPPSPSSSDKSGSSGGSVNKFYSLFKGIQKNIETMNFVTKEIEKINDKFLFHSSTITPAEDSSLMNKVLQLHKDTSVNVRDTSRMIKSLRVETKKPTPSPGSEDKAENEKNEEELAEELRDMGDKENICKNVSKSFTDELLMYQSAIQDFKNEAKERLTKKVQSIRPKASEDFVDMSLRSESSRFALFREIMAADETELSEEDAKALKDEIAEKYIIIAELSLGASELNKVFLNMSAMAAMSDPSASKLSDSENSDEVKRPHTRTKRTSDTTRIVDELLGDPNAARADPSEPSSSMDASTTSSSSKGMRKNRLLNFIRRHRSSSATTEEQKSRFRREFNRHNPSRSNTYQQPRKRRGSRWMALFLLATVALAAMAGIVMIH